MLDHLLDGKRGDVVSLEVLGDTARIRGEKTLIEETKSRTTAGNPISNRSIDFWKTLRNWILQIQSGHVDLEHTWFRLYLSREFHGEIAEQFSLASDLSSARAALESARQQLCGTGSQGSRSPLKTYLAEVFGADPDLVAQLIQRFTLSFGSGRSFEDLKGYIRFVSENVVESVLEHMLGWIKRRVDSAIEAGEPACIRYDDFAAAITVEFQRFNQLGILQTFAAEPSAKEIEEHLRVKRYVRQLELVEVDDDEKIRAVTDYYMAEADRTRWAAQYRINERDVELFESELIRLWGTRRNMNEILNSERPAAIRGRLLYSECSLHRAPLRGETVPEHFCRGSFHNLSDQSSIGWHPDFRDLLGPESDGAG